MFWVQKATAASFALCAVFVVGVGVGLGTRPGSTGAVAQEGFGATAAVKPTKNGPTDELAALEREIQAAEQQQQLRKNQFDLAKKKIKEAKQLGESLTDSKDVQAAIQLSREIEDVESELNKPGGLKDKLLQLKLKLAEANKDGSSKQVPGRETPVKPDVKNNADALVKKIREQAELIESLRREAAKLESSKNTLGQELATRELKRIQAAISKKPEEAQKELDAAKSVAAAIERVVAEQLYGQLRIETAEDELAGLQIQLDKLKMTNPRVFSTRETALMKLDELKAQLARIEAERAQLLVQAETAKKQVAVTEDRLRALQEVIEQVKQAGDRKFSAPGGYLELTVGGTDHTFVIREVRTEVKGQTPAPLGPITTSDPAALAVLLARAKSDPSGPKSVEIKLTDKANRESERAARDACKGFESVRVTGSAGGPAPTKPLSRDDHQKQEPLPSGKPAPGPANKADIDEIIKSLKLKDAELDKRNKAEIDALRKRIEEELNKNKKLTPTKP